MLSDFQTKVNKKTAKKGPLFLAIPAAAMRCSACYTLLQSGFNIPFRSTIVIAA
jgi:hypothetical protein